jgi:hypothetical protein
MLSSPLSRLSCNSVRKFFRYSSCFGVLSSEIEIERGRSELISLFLFLSTSLAIRSLDKLTLRGRVLGEFGLPIRIIFWGMASGVIVLIIFRISVASLV